MGPALRTRRPAGRDRIDSQYLRVNVDPSDRYVLSLPGTARYRLRADESGYDNLVLAGDWTDNGLNAGCIEAAVVSGIQAANAVTGRSHLERVVGYYPSARQAARSTMYGTNAAMNSSAADSEHAPNASSKASSAADASVRA